MSYQYVSRQKGFSLLEVLIAVLVLSLGLLGLANLQMLNLKSSQNSAQKQQVTYLIHELLERMRSNKKAAQQGDYISTAKINCSSPAPSCSADACDGTQIAQADIYAMMCGAGGNGSGLMQQLMNANLSITCPTGACKDSIRIGVSWSERATRPEASTDVESSELFINAVI